jgi:hypothetical protein
MRDPGLVIDILQQMYSALLKLDWQIRVIPKSNPTSAGLKNFLFMASNTYLFRTEAS